MNRTIPMVVMALAGCSMPDTPCGMTLDNYLDGWLTADDLRTAETEMLELLPGVTADPRISDPKVSCEWLNGLRVVPWNKTYWIDQWGRQVEGLAYPARDALTLAHLPGGSVDVGKPSPGAGWRKTSLVHEIMHILQGSIPAAPCAPSDNPHCGWLLPDGPGMVIVAINEKETQAPTP